MFWNTALIYLASERICCMWFGGENVFLLCSQSAQTQHMETFRRSHGSVKKLCTFNFSLFSLGLGSPNWLNYIHLCAICRKIFLMNVIQHNSVSDTLSRTGNRLFWQKWVVTDRLPYVDRMYQWTQYLQLPSQSVINTLPLTWDSCMSALLSAINMLEGLVKYW